MKSASTGRRNNAAVIDTNVFVSAVLGHALQAILDNWQAGSFALIVSDEIIQEYLGVLRRPKFHLTPEIIDPIMAQIFQQAEFVTPDTPVDMIKADPSDNKFIEAAIQGQAAYIVSGDNHLLELQSYEGVKIITAREFLSLLEGESR
jgi:putative PIN family toxin of toxin-antitoxin system